jgi:hypothetical protein
MQISIFNSQTGFFFFFPISSGSEAHYLEPLIILQFNKDVEFVDPSCRVNICYAVNRMRSTLMNPDNGLDWSNIPFGKCGALSATWSILFCGGNVVNGIFPIASILPYTNRYEIEAFVSIEIGI